MSRPPKMTRPLRTARRPMMLSMVVVLPAPLRPTRQTDSRSATAIERLRSTWAGPRKTFSRSSSSIRSGRLGPEQVGGDLRVVADLVGGAVGQDRALVHGHDPRTVREHHVHVVLHDHRGEAAGGDDLTDDVHDRGLLARADPARRLVPGEELGARV